MQFGIFHHVSVFGQEPGVTFSLLLWRFSTHVVICLLLIWFCLIYICNVQKTSKWPSASLSVLYLDPIHCLDPAGTSPFAVVPHLYSLVYSFIPISPMPLFGIAYASFCVSYIFPFFLVMFALPPYTCHLSLPKQLLERKVVIIICPQIRRKWEVVICPPSLFPQKGISFHSLLVFSVVSSQ